jgi:hypothetical protein
MALLDDVDSRRELVKRLVLAELLARPGRGPLALLHGVRGFAPRTVRRAEPEPSREPAGEGEP